jgi:TPP-dependent pyruvate/acetoin dehydrogenase alpha subunit
MTKSNRDNRNAEEGFSLISNQKLLGLYNTMLCCRDLALEASNERKSAGCLLGHEAAVVGAAIDLLPEDTIVHALSPHAAFAAVNSNVSASADIKQAVRSAQASKGGQTTVVFAGSRQVVQQAWHKGLALAAENKLPILFIALKAGESFDAEARHFPIPPTEPTSSLPRINVDGNDVVAIYRVATEAIIHARKGHGPALIECRPSAPDDPILNMREYLIGKGISPTPWPGALAGIPAPPKASLRKPAAEGS